MDRKQTLGGWAAPEFNDYTKCIHVSQSLSTNDHIWDLDLVLAMMQQAATVRAARITEKLITPTQTAPQWSCGHGVRVGH